VPAFGIVEAFDVVEHISPGLVPRPVRFACRSFCLQRREKLSIAALSQTLPERLIEQTTRNRCITAAP
jgi:hypothetical protein